VGISTAAVTAMPAPHRHPNDRNEGCARNFNFRLHGCRRTNGPLHALHRPGTVARSGLLPMAMVAACEQRVECVDRTRPTSSPIPRPWPTAIDAISGVSPYER
jgi:hypothetical protein